MATNKPVTAVIKLQVPAGGANPAPPIGPALGQRGVNIMEFCKAFNDRTKNQESGLILPVVITVYKDRSFTFEIRQPPAAILLKKALGVAKGSATPNSQKIGTLERTQLEQIAQSKMPDLTASDLDAAVRSLVGTARSMGVETTI